MYKSSDRLVILDADGTLIDAFSAIDAAFARQGMDIGDLDRFQKRRNLFKYLGGIKEFPRNLARQMGKGGRRGLLASLTDIYREEARLYPGMAGLIGDLLATPGLKVGLVTRNVTREPALTLSHLFARHGLDMSELDFVYTLNLREAKTAYFIRAREGLGINPAKAYACGDEHKDYAAALAAGIHPFIAAYGFESHARLTRKFLIPDAVVSPSPQHLAACLRHALDIPGE